MRVWRAVGGNQNCYTPDCLASKIRSDAIFVAPDELTAIGWAIVLGKSQVVALEVARIFDKRMREITEFPEAYSGIDGVPLREAVVLSEDIGR